MAAPVPVDVKICGLTTLNAVQAASAAGARHVGFVFYPRSSRALTAAQAVPLAGAAAGLSRVGLFVDPDDALLNDVLDVVPLDAVQLHGDESPDRVRAVKSLTGKPVWKAVPIAEQADVTWARAYENVADFLLFDAKPPTSTPLAAPGGNGLAFDWALIAGESWSLSWGLAGGLDPSNVAEAIRISGTTLVDVSSGVEDAPGVKSAAKIEAFVKAAHAAA